MELQESHRRPAHPATAGKHRMRQHALWNVTRVTAGLRKDMEGPYYLLEHSSNPIRVGDDIAVV
ncbi:hypothetical protein AUR04nite_34790 [Glutamicibacter uratoxydans]|uniref:Uncharacterized protein n=1 Tax=Glutamicibacter uratoxydans TaxID=43667 RepID=A0A4Y4DTI8_GLUUR|nr:hypothetical protein AUR04nite_34790 [Glutamicibacter uratoxydans]